MSGETRISVPHVGPFGLDDGGCKTCAECDLGVRHVGHCDCGHKVPWQMGGVVE